MNKIAVLLNVIGVLIILSGIIIGFSTYKDPIPGYNYITEENYLVLFMWIIAGAISGIMVLGFAEIINLLQDKKNLEENNTSVLKDIYQKLQTSADSPVAQHVAPREIEVQVGEGNTEDIEDIEDIDDIDELRRKLKAEGRSNDFIEAAVISKKKQH